MARVFVSHASADLAVAVDIRTWLREAGHEVFLDRDLAEGIRVGERWKLRLYRELRGADAIVCVVSEAYRASEWCAAEVGLADGLGCPLLPVRIGCGADSPLLDGLQHADFHADPVRARAELVCRLEAIDNAGAGAWPEGRSPYPGLRPFESDMARVFRGRAVETRQLVRRVRSLDEWSGGRLVVVVGPSGCGKSSLVRAGLVPAAAGEPRWEVVAPFAPGIDPVTELARALAVTGNRLGLGWSIETTARRLAGGQTGHTGLREVANDLLIAGRRVPREQLLLVVDQGEELLTRSSPAHLAQFARLLTDGLAGPVRTVVTLRSEFLDRLRAVPELADVELDLFVLRPLDRSMLRTIVREPAAVAGLRAEPELVDRLVADTPGGEALPLLAFILAELARDKTRGDELTTDDYTDLGGVQGALAHHANLALVEAVDATGLDRATVLDALLRLATLDETGQPTRRRLPLARLEPALQHAVEPFIRRRLLVTTTEPDGPLIGVAHEALLTAWRPLAEALDARRSALRRQRAVETAAADWYADDEAPACLWNADRLSSARADLDLATVDDLAELPDLDPVARRFVAASVTRARKVRVRAHRRRVTTVTTLSILLAVAVLLGAVAATQASREQRRAEATERILIAKDLMTRAEGARHRDRDFALRLGLAAHAVSADTAGTEASLLETLSAPHPLSLTTSHHWQSVSVLAFSGRESHRLVSGSGDGSVQVWDVRDAASPGAPDPILAHLGKPIEGLALSPAGTMVAAATTQGIWLWEIGRPPGPPLSNASNVHALAFSPDGSTLAVVAGHGLELWDLAEPSRPVRSEVAPDASDHADTALSVAFSWDSRLIAYGTSDGAVRLWDRRDARLTATLGPHASPATVVFSPDALTLATGAADGLRLWDLTAPDAPPIGYLRGGALDVVAFSSAGRTVLVRSAEGDPQLVDVTAPGTPQVLDAGLPSAQEATSMALAPDGHTLAIGRPDWKLELWETEDPRRLRPLGTVPDGQGVPDDLGRLVAFIDDDTLLMTGTKGVARWDVHDRHHPDEVALPPPAGTSYVGSIGFAPARNTIALLVAPTEPGEPGIRQAQLWNGTARSGPRPAGLPLTDIGEPAALSPDGQLLATDTEAGIELREVTTEARSTLSRLPIDAVYGKATALAFSPDGQLLVVTNLSGSEARLSLWDVTNSSAPDRLGVALSMEADASITDVAVSPNKRILAFTSTTANGSAVALWDIADPELPRQVVNRLTTGPGTTLNALTFSADSSILAVGSIDFDGYNDVGNGTVQMWDVTAPDEPRPLGPQLAGNAGGITSLAFSPNGRTLAVASAGSGNEPSVIAQLWDLGHLLDIRRAVVQKACDETGSLSEQEWHLLAHGVPFTDPCSRARATNRE